ncbi:uncharacterized protein F4822DRAFT_296067 [Hypoxylon trugodes]|uniref:uncharacterized protein n=1 Tax=Hypoxylon trugodes TaxID=326681 RepID=UPI00219C0355|nr:uncharacterized protein F4822DRAFT_296067 [Hypoxylon trugodes]KAI1387919.1 hypothetical protein F4822DRAFT_296067 [Hypoxylon trugodes]
MASLANPAHSLGRQGLGYPQRPPSPFSPSPRLPAMSRSERPTNPPRVAQLTNLVCLTKPPNPARHVESKAVDIIAVHGLGGSGDTWKTRDGVMWLRDLIPKDLKSVRILTFNYDVLELFGGSTENFKCIVKRLLDGIVAVRSQAPPTRPLVLIGHDVGGLLIEASMNQIWGTQTDYSGLKDCVKAIVFLGTPQRESPEESWLKIFEQLVRSRITSGIRVTKDWERQLSTWISRNGEELRKIPIEFKKCASGRRIFSCFEQLPTPTQSILCVNEFQATLAIRGEKTKEMMGCDHHSIATFSNREDENYVFIISTIKKARLPSKPKPQRTQPAQSENSDTSRLRQNIQILQAQQANNKGSVPPQPNRRVEGMIKVAPVISRPMPTRNHPESMRPGTITKPNIPTSNTVATLPGRSLVQRGPSPLAQGLPPMQPLKPLMSSGAMSYESRPPPIPRQQNSIPSGMNIPSVLQVGARPSSSQSIRSTTMPIVGTIGPTRPTPPSTMSARQENALRNDIKITLNMSDPRKIYQPTNGAPPQGIQQARQPPNNINRTTSMGTVPQPRQEPPKAFSPFRPEMPKDPSSQPLSSNLSAKRAESNQGSSQRNIGPIGVTTSRPINPVATKQNSVTRKPLPSPAPPQPTPRQQAPRNGTGPMPQSLQPGTGTKGGPSALQRRLVPGAPGNVLQGLVGFPPNSLTAMESRPPQRAPAGFAPTNPQMRKPVRPPPQQSKPQPQSFAGMPSQGKSPMQGSIRALPPPARPQFQHPVSAPRQPESQKPHSTLGFLGKAFSSLRGKDQPSPGQRSIPQAPRDQQFKAWTPPSNQPPNPRGMNGTVQHPSPPYVQSRRDFGSSSTYRPQGGPNHQGQGLSASYYQQSQSWNANGQGQASSYHGNEGGQFVNVQVNPGQAPPSQTPPFQLSQDQPPSNQAPPNQPQPGFDGTQPQYGEPYPGYEQKQVPNTHFDPAPYGAPANNNDQSHSSGGWGKAAADAAGGIIAGGAIAAIGVSILNQNNNDNQATQSIGNDYLQNTEIETLPSPNGAEYYTDSSESSWEDNSDHDSDSDFNEGEGLGDEQEDREIYQEEYSNFGYDNTEANNGVWEPDANILYENQDGWDTDKDADEDEDEDENSDEDVDDEAEGNINGDYTYDEDIDYNYQGEYEAYNSSDVDGHEEEGEAVDDDDDDNSDGNEYEGEYAEQGYGEADDDQEAYEFSYENEGESEEGEDDDGGNDEDNADENQGYEGEYYEEEVEEVEEGGEEGEAEYEEEYVEPEYEALEYEEPEEGEYQEEYQEQVEYQEEGYQAAYQEEVYQEEEYEGGYEEEEYGESYAEEYIGEGYDEVYDGGEYWEE